MAEKAHRKHDIPKCLIVFIHQDKMYYDLGFYLVTILSKEKNMEKLKITERQHTSKKTGQG